LTQAFCDGVADPGGRQRQVGVSLMNSVTAVDDGVGRSVSPRKSSMRRPDGMAAAGLARRSRAMSLPHRVPRTWRARPVGDWRLAEAA